MPADDAAVQSAQSTTVGLPRTLPEALAAAGPTGRGVVFHPREGEVRASYERLAEDAERRAGALERMGVGPGDRVALLGPNELPWAQWATAVWRLGATLVPLQFPLHVRDGRAFADRTRRLLEAAGCRAVIAHPRFLPLLPDRVAHDWTAEPDARGSIAAPGPRPEDPAVVQFTSGSTSFPKGVVLTHAAVTAGMGAHLEAMAIGTDDRIFAWLPLFHDNGLFGHLVVGLLARCESHFMTTERFARAPSLWFRVMSEHAITISSGPPSGWHAALRSVLRNPGGIDLSALRHGVVGAEAIGPAVVDDFLEHGPSLGLDPTALFGAYGLAEATLGVAMSPGEGLLVDRVDAAALSEEGLAGPSRGSGPSKRVVSCGRPLPGMAVRVTGDGGPLPERRVGAIEVCSPSLMRGYAGVPDEDQPFTADGWLQTGDLGYIADGRLYVTGRSKDLLIVMGRNYAPEDLEWVAGRVAGVRLGAAVAFSSDDVGRGEGDVLVAVEPMAGVAAADLARSVRNAILDQLGVPLAEVLVVAKGSIPRTTSGKLQRHAFRQAHARREVQLAGVE